MWKRLATVVCLVWAVAAQGSSAADWGSLTATFVFDGDAPDAPLAKITSDKEFCTAFHVLDESLVIDKQTRGVANVILFMVLGPRDPKPPVREPASSAVANEVFLDNKHCRFDPHVVLLQTSQTLVVGNSDSVGHNTNLATFRNPQFNELIPSGGQKQVKLKTEEPLPVKVACNIHPWMFAWVVVKDHPYMAVSDQSGKLEIKDLPVGEWSFQLWQEKAGYLRDVAFSGGVTDRRGRFTLTVKPGENALGEIRLSPTLFQ